MTTTTGFDSKTNQDGSVTYWSVYKQSWQTATTQEEIPSREWAAQAESDRNRFRALPQA